MSNSKMTAGIYTLGCKVNQYESEAIAEELQKRGFTLSSPSSECDLYVINTCTVTAESDRKARQFIRRAMSKNPQAFIIVTGCLAQTAQEKLAKIKGIDAIVGNSQKLLCADIALELVQSGEKPSSPQIHVSDINSLREFAICPRARYICDAICPAGHEGNLYHIATEQSEVISHFAGRKIYRI